MLGMQSMMCRITISVSKLEDAMIEGGHNETDDDIRESKPAVLNAAV